MVGEYLLMGDAMTAGLDLPILEPPCMTADRRSISFRDAEKMILAGTYTKNYYAPSI